MSSVFLQAWGPNAPAGLGQKTRGVIPGWPSLASMPGGRITPCSSQADEDAFYSARIGALGPIGFWRREVSEGGGHEVVCKA